MILTATQDTAFVWPACPTSGPRERFSLFDADTLIYRFEIEDPTAFTQPWKGELTISSTSSVLSTMFCFNVAVSGLV